MKKIVHLSLICVVIVTGISSCGSGEDKKEVKVVTAPSQRIIIEKEPAKKSTTITLDKKGVKVEGKKINVTVKKD